MWSGAISFGLVNVPIKLYSAVSKKTVRFHQINAETGSRIQQKRVDATTGEEVPYENLVKGYQLTRDRYVIINPDELDALDPEKSRTIDIEDFVDLSEIDPVYYDHPYYLVPDKGAEKAYGLLLNAMQESQRVAIARVVLRSKEQLVAIRPDKDGRLLMMETMIFADEVVPTEDLDGLPEAEELDGLAPEKTRTIDIEDFVDLEEIDPIYYDHPYYLAPDTGAAKAYGLLLGAMQESGKVAIARVVLRSKEQLVAIRPAQDGSVLMMETMIFADEVVPKEDLDGLPEADELKVSERESQMAQQLIESLVTDFEPSRYKDEYREKVLELIEAKAAGAEIVAQPEAPQPTAVPDLMAALEASLAAVSSSDTPKKGSKPAAKEKAAAK
jgi:DNA end-binding protein Ku